jgi:hypothetical protein
MACGSCGKRREEFLRGQAQQASGKTTQAQERASSVPARPHVDSAEALLRYMGDQPFKVRGESSGRDYEFTPQSAVQFVDTRDVARLMRTGRFRHLA